MTRNIDVPTYKEDSKSAIIAKDSLVTDVPLIKREKLCDYNEANDVIFKKSKYTQDDALAITVELDRNMIVKSLELDKKKAKKIIKKEYRKHKSKNQFYKDVTKQTTKKISLESPIQPIPEPKPISPEDLKIATMCFPCTRGKHNRCFMKRQKKACNCPQCSLN